MTIKVEKTNFSSH